MAVGSKLYLYYRFRPDKSLWTRIDPSSFREEYRQLGRTTIEQKIILTDFILLALLWLTRSDIPLGSLVIPGWSGIFKAPAFINDGTVAIMMSVPLFFIPSRSEKGKYLMDWNTATKLPWDIVLLFGGGFALATGFIESGLSGWFGQQLRWCFQSWQAFRLV